MSGDKPVIKGKRAIAWNCLVEFFTHFRAARKIATFFCTDEIVFCMKSSFVSDACGNQLIGKFLVRKINNSGIVDDVINISSTFLDLRKKREREITFLITA